MNRLINSIKSLFFNKDVIGEIKNLNNKSKVVLKITIKKDKDIFIAYCPALDLVDYGKTVRMAEKNLKITTKLFLESCIKRNVLKDVLRDCGWKKYKKEESKTADLKTTIQILVKPYSLT